MSSLLGIWTSRLHISEYKPQERIFFPRFWKKFFLLCFFFPSSLFFLPILLCSEFYKQLWGTNEFGFKKTENPKENHNLIQNLCWTHRKVRMANKNWTRAGPVKPHRQQQSLSKVVARKHLWKCWGTLFIIWRSSLNPLIVTTDTITLVTEICSWKTGSSPFLCYGDGYFWRKGTGGVVSASL